MMCAALYTASVMLCPATEYTPISCPKTKNSIQLRYDKALVVICLAAPFRAAAAGEPRPPRPNWPCHYEQRFWPRLPKRDVE